MKISIEIDVSKDELPFATEMIKTLRLLTEHVKVNTAAPAGPTAAEPPPATPAAGAAPAPGAAPAATAGARPAPAPGPGPGPAPGPKPGPQPGEVPPGRQQRRTALLQHISSLESKELNPVKDEINKILPDGSDTPEVLEAVEDLLEAFNKVAFHPDLVRRQQSNVCFMYVLPALKEPYCIKLRDRLVHMVLKFLTVKRTVDASRAEFFSYAEAFAALVNMEYVNINGAITTIRKLLSKPENRCAAITMLGKTVELCYNHLQDKAEAAELQALQTQLTTVEPCFSYDVEYIRECMGWQDQDATVVDDPSAVSVAESAAAGTGALPFGTKLEAENSYRGHTNTIFAMSYDDSQGMLVSSGKDGNLIVWGSDGMPEEKVEIARHYACSMDIESRTGSMFICGVAKEDLPPDPSGHGPAPCIMHFNLKTPNWQQYPSVYNKETAKLITCIKAISESDGSPKFITGETIRISGQGAGYRGESCEERVCYYDLERAAVSHGIQPVVQYAEHEDMIVCVASFPSNPNLFLSGSRDATVRIWDRRKDSSVGVCGRRDASGKVKAHGNMITCLDAGANEMVLSASMDKDVSRWDLRRLGQDGGCSPVSSTNISNSPVLKVAIGGGGYQAAVSTVPAHGGYGLYMVDFAGGDGDIPITPAQGFQDDRRVGRYHDLKWAHSRGCLFAAGDQNRVDVYKLKP